MILKKLSYEIAVFSFVKTAMTCQKTADKHVPFSWTRLYFNQNDKTFSCHAGYLHPQMFFIWESLYCFGCKIIFEEVLTQYCSYSNTNIFRILFNVLRLFMTERVHTKVDFAICNRLGIQKVK